MKFIIKNLEVSNEVKLGELQFEITSQDIKENGKNILNIIKEVKPLVDSYFESQKPEPQSKEPEYNSVQPEIDAIKNIPKNSFDLKEFKEFLDK